MDNNSNNSNNSEKRVALMAIAVDDVESVGELNELLHSYGRIIIGRMGIPYKERSTHLISVAVDGTNDEINTLSGKIGKIRGVSVKTVFAKAGK